MFRKRHIFYFFYLFSPIIFSVFPTNYFIIINNSYLYVLLGTSLIIISLIIERKLKLSDFKETFFFIPSLFILVFINGGGIGPILNTFIILIHLIILPKISLPHEQIQLLILILLFLNFYWLINSKDYYEKFIIDNYLNESGKMINPNSIAIINFMTYAFVFYYLLSFKSIFFYLFAILVTVSTFIIIMNTQSRGVQLTFISFVLINLFLSSKPSENKLAKTNFILFFVVIIGIFLPFLIVYFYANDINVIVFFPSKSLFTGREIIWLEYINTFSDNPLSIFIGLGSSAELMNIDTINIHNLYLTFIINFGLIGFLFFFVYFLKVFNNSYRARQFKDNYLVAMTFVCLIYGYIETSFQFTPFTPILLLGFVNLPNKKFLNNFAKL